MLNKADNIGRAVRDGVLGDRHDIRNRDAHVEAAVRLCDRAIRRYTALRTESDSVEPDQGPLHLLDELAERVDGLRDQNSKYPTNLEDKTRATEIYYHLVRKLIDLVKASILCYEALDTGAEGQGEISMDHLETVVELMKLVSDLIVSAQKYARPPSHRHVVQPVRELFPLLRNIRHALMREMQHHELSQQTQRRQEQQHRDRVTREQDSARRKQQETLVNQFREKWQKLHTERMLVEGGLMRASKRAHLAIPDEYHTEYDHNGIPFEREQIFHPRIGPPPDLVEAALSQVWSMVELSALRDGLRAYTGEHVFERTFRKYCGPGRELNKYSVTEIVTTAVQIKEFETASRRKNGAEVEQWILDIPVWTKVQHGEGQENEDAVEADEGDLTMSGGNGEADVGEEVVA